MPVLPPEIKAWFLPVTGGSPSPGYAPCVVGIADVHYTNSRHGVDESARISLVATIGDGPEAVDWSTAADLELEPQDLDETPAAGARFAELPRKAQNPKSFAGWTRDFERFIRQEKGITLFRSDTFKLTSRPGESESAFRARLSQAAREKRDLEIAKLAPKKADKDSLSEMGKGQAQLEALMMKKGELERIISNLMKAGGESTQPLVANSKGS